jgi:hypothetical protein
VRNQGGGERTTMGIHGTIVSKDTIELGNIPCPPRDKISTAFLWKIMARQGLYYSFISVAQHWLQNF